MFAGMALSVLLLVYAGLSLFTVCGPYLYMVVCVLYAYNLTLNQFHQLHANIQFGPISGISRKLITHVKPLALIVLPKKFQFFYYMPKCTKMMVVHFTHTLLSVTKV